MKNPIYDDTRPRQKPSDIPSPLISSRKNNLSTNLEPWCQPQAALGKHKKTEQKHWFGVVLGCFVTANETILLSEKNECCVDMERFQTRDKVNFLHAAKLTGKFF